MPLITGTVRFTPVILPLSDYYQVARSIAPLGYWRFGETSGSNATNVIGTGNGIYSNSPTLGTTGLIVNDTDTAVIFDGTTQFVNLGAFTNFNSFPVSFVFWVNCSSFAALNAVINSHAGTSTYTGISVIIETDGNIAVRYGDGGGIGSTNRKSFKTTVSPASVSTTHEVAVVCTDFNTVAVYVDGVEYNTTTSGTGASISYTGTFEAARDTDLFVDAYLSGTLDEPKVIKGILTPTDVKRLHIVGSTGSADNYRTLSLAQSPVGYWRLGETSGTTANDETSNNFNGTYSGDYTLNQGGALTNDTDPSVDFGGTTSQVQSVANHNFGLNGVTEMSFSAWVYPTSYASIGYILCKRGSGASGYACIRVALRSDISELAFNVESGANLRFPRWGVPHTSCPLNEWTHIAFVWKRVGATGASTDGKIYINGIDAGATFTDGAPAYIGHAFLISEGAAQWRIGEVSDNTGGSGRFIGRIDEVRVYDRELSEAEVVEDYSMGIHGPNTYAYLAHKLDPFAYWRLGESSGNAIDETDNGYDGAPSGIIYSDPGALVGDPDTSYRWAGGLPEVNLGTQLNAPMSGATHLSVVGWIYFNTIPAVVNSGRVFMRNDSSIYFYYYYQNGSTHGLWFHLPGITTAFSNLPSIPTGSLTTATWYHIAGTYNSVSGEAKIYLDGALVDTTTGLSGTIAGSAAVTMLGVTSTGGFYRHDGNIDEVSMYLKELSAPEIKMLYDKGQAVF